MFQEENWIWKQRHGKDKNENNKILEIKDIDENEKRTKEIELEENNIDEEQGEENTEIQEEIEIEEENDEEIDENKEEIGSKEVTIDDEAEIINKEKNKKGGPLSKVMELEEVELFEQETKTPPSKKLIRAIFRNGK